MENELPSSLQQPSLTHIVTPVDSSHQFPTSSPYVTSLYNNPIPSSFQHHSQLLNVTSLPSLFEHPYSPLSVTFVPSSFEQASSPLNVIPNYNLHTLPPLSMSSQEFPPSFAAPFSLPYSSTHPQSPLLSQEPGHSSSPLQSQSRHEEQLQFIPIPCLTSPMTPPPPPPPTAWLSMPSPFCCQLPTSPSTQCPHNNFLENSEPVGSWYPARRNRLSKPLSQELPPLMPSPTIRAPKPHAYVGMRSSSSSSSLPEMKKVFFSKRNREVRLQVEALYLSLFDHHQARPKLLASQDISRGLGLEQVWNQHFELLFGHLPHVWTFGPTEKPPNDWTVFKDMAKVRFSCQRCSHGWTSMYGLVVFYYHWNGTTGQGAVRFCLTGQKCKHCNPDIFETPMWYPEEAQKVMTNLYHEVVAHVYHLETPPLIRDRRHGRPRQEHNAQMCEGCHRGMCKTPRNSHSSQS